MITIHFWYDRHFTNISACGVWGVKVKTQVSRRELYIYTLRLG